MSDNTLTIGSTTKNGQIAESDLQYTPPDNTPTFNLRQAEEDFIKSLLAGDEPPARQPERRPTTQGSMDELEQEIAPDDGAFVDDDIQADPDVDIVDPETGESAGPGEPEPEDPRGADKAVERGIGRIVQRELAAKEREKAAEAREKAAEQRIAELKKYESLKPTAEVAELMGVDPLGAIQALGHDPFTTIKLAFAQQLGDKAPQELKDFAKEFNGQREIRQIRAELQAERQAAAAQKYFNTVSEGAREYVTKNLGDPKAVKAYPSLSKAAKVDPAAVHDDIMEEIVSEAQRQAARDPNGEPISYDEAAARVEKRFARIAKLLSVSSMTPGAKTVLKPGQKQPPTAKAPAKPIAPWQRPADNLYEDGIKDALLEYERAEAARKARR